MTRFFRLAALISILSAGHALAAEDWRVYEPESRIGFVATYDGIPFDARFESFDAQIRFSPDDLAGSLFDIRIDVASVDSDSADRDEGMTGAEWFAVGRHPEARFRSQRFEHRSGNRYVAVGELSLKDVTKTIEVPFTWEPQPTGGVLLEAETVVQRGSFNIGTGEWAEDDIIGFDVTAKARLKLTAANSE